MPSIRYYDYGVMRRESAQRMYDAQRQSALQHTPLKRITPDNNTSAHPVHESSPIISPGAPELSVDNSAEQHISEADREPREKPAACRHCGKPGIDLSNASVMFSSEELLIAALLLLAINENSGLPLVLALLYLLL